VTARVRVDLGARGYDVVIGAACWDDLGPALDGRRRVAIVTQAAVQRYAARAAAVLEHAGIEHTTLVMGDGEDAKSLATVEDLARRLAVWGFLRNDAVVAVGGGVVGDTAGFLASVYSRGVDVLQVPTTLLAMVDAAIGGKTAVNLPEGKNLVGSFHQPRAVLADPAVLATLPDREYCSGLGEVAKYALSGDGELREIVATRAEALCARDPEVLAEVVARCAAAKAAVVAADELERTGVRAQLNYGHTLAHALETAGGYGLLHGEAVAVGLVFAAHLAGALERITPAAVAQHEAVVSALGLPVRAPAGLRAGDLLAIMGRDKKSGGGLTFVLGGPNGIERVDDPDPRALRTAFAAVGVED
jgi:3-dehydroquinate synthase